MDQWWAKPWQFLVKLDRGAAAFYATKPFQGFALALVLLMLIWFCAQADFFKDHVRYGIPPDEIHHVEVIRLFAEADGATIDERPATYQFGTLNHMPYLYHYTYGKLAIDEPADLKVPELRDYNWYLAVLFFFSAFLLFRMLSSDPWVWVIGAVTLSNIPMLSFSYGTVTYDTWINLFSAVALCLLVLFVRHNSARALIFLLCVTMLGCLVKVTFLPWVLIFGIVILTQLPKWRVYLQDLKSKSVWELSIYGTLFVTLFVLCCRLYLYNLIEFGGIYPGADQVWGAQAAMEHYPQYRVVEQLRESRAHIELMPFFFDYLKMYSISATATTFGIMGHQSISRALLDCQYYWYALLPAAFGFVLLLARTLFLRQSGGLKNLAQLAFWTVLGVTLAYSAVVVVDSYRSYSIHRTYGAGLQGRYLFAVVAGACAVYAICACQALPNLLKPLFALLLFSFMHYMGSPAIVQEMANRGGWFATPVVQAQGEHLLGSAAFDQLFLVFSAWLL